jgi:uncharacterized protein (DUF2141 family)
MPFSFLTLARGAVSASLIGLAVSMASPALAQPEGAAPAGCTGPASATWLRVVVEGVRSSQGLVAITLYANDSSRFLVRHGSLYVGRTKAVAGTTDSCIYVPKPGTYAIAVYHDENGNQKFDRNMFGLPAEAYGFSNNPGTLFGLPSFRSVRLKVDESGETIHIHLHYP